MLPQGDLEQAQAYLDRRDKTYEQGGTVHQQIGGFNRGYYIGVMDGRSLGLVWPLTKRPAPAGETESSLATGRARARSE